MKNITLICVALLLVSCHSGQSDKKAISSEEISYEGLKVYTIYKKELTIALDPVYEKFNIAELIAVAEKQPKSSFINQIFNQDKLELAQALGANYHVFIDTSSYTNFIHLEKMKKYMPISKRDASIIGGIFKNNLQVSSPEAYVNIESAKFGKQPTYTYGYYKMTADAPRLSTYSNHYAISTDKSSFLIYNVSLENIDLSELKKYISFQ